jgi:hypothetical protein
MMWYTLSMVGPPAEGINMIRFSAWRGSHLLQLKAARCFILSLSYSAHILANKPSSSFNFRARFLDGSRNRSQCGSLGLDVVKGFYKCYSLWSDRDDDVASVRHELSWLEKLFASMESTLKNNELDQTQVRRICRSLQWYHHQTREKARQGEKGRRSKYFAREGRRPRTASTVPVSEGNNRSPLRIDWKLQGTNTLCCFSA